MDINKPEKMLTCGRSGHPYKLLALWQSQRIRIETSWEARKFKITH